MYREREIDRKIERQRERYLCIKHLSQTLGSSLPPCSRAGPRASGAHKGGFSKGGYSN